MSFFTVLEACFYSSNYYSSASFALPVLFSSSAFYARVICILFFIRLRSINESCGGLFVIIVFALLYYALLGSGNSPCFRCYSIGFPVSGLIFSWSVLSTMASFFFFILFSFLRVIYRFSLSIMLPICEFNFDNFSM